MKHIERFWNLIYYNIYILENKVSLIVLHPFFAIFKKSKVKQAYEKRGVENADEIIRDALMNPNYGSNSVRAGGIMGVILLFLFLSLYCLYTGFFLTELNLKIYTLLILIGLVFGINYILLFKNKLYMEYFKEFSSMSKRRKVTYAGVTIFFVLFSIALLVSSFIYMDYLLHK